MCVCVCVCVCGLCVRACVLTKTTSTYGTSQKVIRLTLAKLPSQSARESSKLNFRTTVKLNGLFQWTAKTQKKQKRVDSLLIYNAK